MMWVWVVTVLVIIAPSPKVGRVLCVFMHCSHVNYTSPIVGSMMLVQIITVMSGGMFILWRGF
jgi:hypothetical protein